MRTFGAALLIFVAFLVITPEFCASQNNSSSTLQLRQGFYLKSCPSAERIVRQTVNRAIDLNPGIAAGLIRVYFHDCFVRGCDASILLKSIGNSSAEIDSGFNGPTIRGLEVIHKAKARLEAICPKTVSCADIMAFAARDSTLKVGGFFYSIPSGRRDGTVSLASNVGQNLPDLTPDVKHIQTFFTRKGLSAKELTTLLGAHSIGHVACSFVTSRLYPNTDPALDPKFASFLKKKCPTNGNGLVNLDNVTPNRLDNQYYKNLKNKMGVLGIDQALASSPLTDDFVTKFVKFPEIWAKEFAAAMVHLGSIDVLTGNKGEIREKCDFVN